MPAKLKLRTSGAGKRRFDAVQDGGGGGPPPVIRSSWVKLLASRSGWDICRHIFVGGYRGNISCWVPNGDDDEVAENTFVVQSFAL